MATSPLKYSFHKTLLDLEIDGSPLNSPNYNHSQNYTPYLPFNHSKEGRIAGKGKLVFGFDKTSLDVENPNPLGGPNRTNSHNIPTGQYQNTRTNNLTDLTENQVLHDKGGQAVWTQLNRWTPTNKYIDSKDWEDKFNQY